MIFFQHRPFKMNSHLNYSYYGGIVSLRFRIFSIRRIIFYLRNFGLKIELYGGIVSFHIVLGELWFISRLSCVGSVCFGGIDSLRYVFGELFFISEVSGVLREFCGGISSFIILCIKFIPPKSKSKHQSQKASQTISMASFFALKPQNWVRNM